MTPGDSVLSHLRLGRSEWPDSLVPPDVHARLVAAAGKFPEPITGIIIEAHLSHPSRTDFGVCVSRRERDLSLRSGKCPEPFRPFFTLWKDRSHPASRLRRVEIECDMGDTDTDPFLSPALEPALLAGFHAVERRYQEERAAGRKRLTLEISPPILRALDPALPDALFAQLERCCDALPAYGVVIPVWSGSARPGALPEPAIRATFGMPRFSLRPYLTALRWTGDIGRVERYADLLGRSSPWVGFDADIVQGGLGSRIGLYHEHWWVRPWDSDLTDTVDRLDALGLCDPSRLQGLRAWVASQPERPQPGEARSLSLKVVLTGDRPLVVKAYLSTFDVAFAADELDRHTEREASTAAP